MKAVHQAFRLRYDVPGEEVCGRFLLCDESLGMHINFMPSFAMFFVILCKITKKCKKSSEKNNNNHPLGGDILRPLGADII